MSENKQAQLKKVRILIRVDANHDVGLGHIVRISELLRHIQTPLDIHICGVGDQLKLFINEDITLHQLEKRDGESKRTLDFLKLAEKIKADILLIDHPDQNGERWQKYAQCPIPVIAIDDYGGDVQADMIINGTILSDYHKYPLITEKTAIHIGGKYALLNPVFRANIWESLTENNLLIVIGGGDRARKWAFALTGEESPFSHLKFDKITMVIGGSFSNTDKLMNSCDQLDIELCQNIQQEKLAKLFAGSSMSLLTGGMVVYEALASGCPAIIFPQEENLIKEASWFAEHNSLLNTGYDAGMDMDKVGKMISLLYSDDRLKYSISSNARMIVDGKGIIRAGEELDIFFRNDLAN